MKIHLDPSHYQASQRAGLTDLLKPYINKRNIDENIQIYGPQITQYQVVPTMAEADLYVLAMSWNFYYQTGQIALARDYVQNTLRQGKKVVIWGSSDFSLRLPFQDAWLFQANGYRSRRKPHQFSYPVFISDPLGELGLKQIQLRAKGQQPMVGFCGQANDLLHQKIFKTLKFFLHNLSFYLHLSPYEPVPLYLPTTLREDALALVEREPDIKTDFIKRRHYRGGARSAEESRLTRQQFLENLRNTDYTICVRGTGNFSVRLYETLAMGRIPIFVDTDCILPLDHLLDWKRYCVRVDSKELHTLPQRVLEFHHSLDEQGFLEMQRQARKLWEKYLSFSGYFTHFPSHFQDQP